MVFSLKASLCIRRKPETFQQPSDYPGCLSLTCPGRRRTGRRRAPSSLGWRPIPSATWGPSWTAEETPRSPPSSQQWSSSPFSSLPARTELSVIKKGRKPLVALSQQTMLVLLRSADVTICSAVFRAQALSASLSTGCRRRVTVRFSQLSSCRRRSLIFVR